MSTPSQDLLRESCQGNRDALDELLVRHLADLRAFVRMRMSPALRGQEASLDIVQSTCRKILERPDRVELRGEREFRNWLFGAVDFEVKNHLRKLRTEKRNPAREVRIDDAQASSLVAAYSKHSPSQHAIAAEQLARIEAAVDELTEDQREVFRLSRFIGLSTAEIAERLGKSNNAVSAMLYRAVSRISVHLERDT